MLQILQGAEGNSFAVRAYERNAVALVDDNPEHIHLFSPDQLLYMAKEAGGIRTTVEHVLNHRIVLIRAQI